MNSQVGEMCGKYEIRRLLGKGGMGEVYEAFDTDKGRTVALKLLTDQYAQDEQFRTRFLRESRAAAVLTEPHVIPIHDWGEIDGVLYIDMRLVQGSTLYEMLETGALEPERAVDIIQQIAAALDAAHAHSLIHRDIKPQNIIVTPDDFAYLVDFGIAEAKGDSHVTIAGYQVGSMGYMAPERFGDQAATSAVDVYSLACVLHEALTGAPPFPNNSLEQLIAAHMTSSPPRASALNGRVPASLDEVIARGMAKDPDDRYGTAGALGRAAKRALSARPVAPSAADTMLAPQAAALWGVHSPPPAAQPIWPPTGPTVVLGAQHDGRRSGQWVVPTIAVVAVALLLAAVGVVFGLLANRNSGSVSPSQTNAYPAITTVYSVPGTTASRPNSSVTSPTSSIPHRSVSASSTPTVTSDDPEEQLRLIASGDRSWVRAQFEDRWVPQLSSKRPGVVDEGVVWDNAMTLREYRQLSQRYDGGVSLLWSGDWSDFSAANFWVTIANISFTDSTGALAWCAGQRFDRDHCAAKLVSTTHPVEGSTAYN